MPTSRVAGLSAARALEGDVEHDGPTTGWGRTRRALVAALVFATAAVLPGIHAFGAGSPAGDVAAPWPVAWSVYRYADGTAIIDVNGDENPVDTDLASGPCVGAKCTGSEPSVFWAGDGTNVFFRIRLASDPWDATKGGLRSSAYLVQLAINGTVAAVVGVDGKSASSDYVYVTDSVGGVVNPIYTWPFDASGGINSAALRTVPDGLGQFFLDFQVPLARMTAINPAITSTTGLQLYYGSSAAANLATINKDLMRGDVSGVDFTGLGTVTFGAAGLALSRTVTSISGTDPPTTGAPSTYDIPLTLTQTGGADLDDATFTATVPAGVTVSSLSTATGTISQSGSTITWTAGTLTSGASATATVRVSVTPAGDAAGSTMTLLSSLAATGTDHTTGAARSATAADVTVGPVAQGNRPPTTVSDSLTVDEDASGSVGVLANDVDPDGDALTATIVGAPSNGSASMTAGGALTYTPDADFHGADSITYRACDPAGACTDGTVTITVDPVNDAPVAVGADLTTVEDTPLSDTAGAGDVDGDDLTFSVVGQPVAGSVSMSPSGAFTYTPDPGTSGVDDFTFEACDPAGACSTAVVTVTVTAVDDTPVANDDTASVDEDDTVAIDVLANDVDGDGDALTPSIVSGPTSGSVVVGAGGLVTYTPDANFHGTDSFTYQACDTGGLCSSAATVTVTVAPVNDAPVAGDDTASEDEDVAVVIDVLANDGDVDGDALTVTIATPPADGSVTVGAGGAITYTPDPDVHGTDTFTYSVCDGAGACDTATVTVTVTPVNDAPVASGATLTTDEDTPGGGTLVAGDVDGDDLTFDVVVPAEHGTVAMQADGTYTYTPESDFRGVDEFTYEACDASGACATAVVTITVSPVNDAPVAGDDAASAGEDGSVSIDVLANDVDVDGDAVSVAGGGLSTPAHGTATVEADGSITYVPEADYAGADSFTYTACDPSGACAVATVDVTVAPANDGPVAAAIVLSTDEDTPVGGTATADDVDGDDLTFSIVSGPGSGSVSMAPDGTFTYTPDADTSGPDSFTYRACDPSASCDAAIVSIVVDAVNDAPVAAGASLDTPEGQAISSAAAASDVDGDVLEFSVVADPSSGMLTLDPAGAFTYTPDAGFNGVDQFTFQACDPAGACSAATVSIDVGAVNDAPVAGAGTLSTNEDTAAGGTLTATDADGDSLTFTIAAGPTNGTLALDSDGTYTYTPDPDFHGTDTFTFEACDPAGACDTAVVTITVAAVNEPPAALDGTAQTPAGVAVIGTIVGTDGDGDVLSWVVTTPPAHGTVEPVAGQPSSYRYTPDPGWSGVDTFVVDVCDPSGDCAPATITVTVLAAQAPPATTTTTIAVAPTTSTTAPPAPAAEPAPIIQLPMLPRTGAGLLVQALGGLGLLGLGGAFVVAGRRRRTSSD